MAKSKFNLTQFKAEVSRDGLARQNKFEVSINIPRALQSVYKDIGQKLTLYCDTAALPAQIVGVRPQRLYGPTIYKPFGVEYGGEGMPFSFYVDKTMDIKSFFDAWISKIVDPYQYFVYYRTDYAVTIDIDQLDEQNNIVYSVRLYDAFPRSVNMMELNYANQNTVHKLMATFAYRNWVPVHRLSDQVKYPELYDQEADTRGQIGARITGGGYRIIPGTTLDFN